MFGKMGDMMNMMSKLKEAQKNIENVKQQLDQEYLTEFSADEKVKVTVSLAGTIKEIDLLGSYENPADLQETLKNTLNTVLSEARERYEKQLAENAMEGMPDLSGLMGK